MPRGLETLDRGGELRPVASVQHDRSSRFGEAARHRKPEAGGGAGDEGGLAGEIKELRRGHARAHLPISLSARFLCAASAIRRRSRHVARSPSFSAGKRARRSASILSIAGPLQSARLWVEGKMRA